MVPLMSIKSQRVGLIGTGRVAEHYLSLRDQMLTPFIDYEICFDTNTEVLDNFSKKYLIPTADSMEEIYKADLDFVIIATPSGTHFEVARELLLKGKNVLIEKPACLRVEEVQELINLSRKLNLNCLSIFQNRFNLAVQEALRLIKKNEIGDPTSFSLRLIWSRPQSYYQDEWHGKWKLDGGVTSQQAIHHLDCVNYILGIPKKVFAVARNSINHLEAEDTLVGTARLSSDILGTFHFTTAARPSDQEASLFIVGKKGSLKISGIALNNLEIYDAVKESWTQIVFEEVTNGYGLGHAANLKAFIDGSQTGPLATLEESRSALMLVDALYESVESGLEVEVRRSLSRSKLGL